MTNTEYMRERLLNRCGLSQFPLNDRAPSLDVLKITEWSSLFETYMRNRLIMGALRYGGIKTRTSHSRYEASIIRRLKLYKNTGNSEHLVDIANLCLVLFVSSDHPKHHFKTGDGEEHC